MPESITDINTCRSCGSQEGPFFLQGGTTLCEDCSESCDECGNIVDLSYHYGDALCDECVVNSYWCDQCAERGRTFSSYDLSEDTLCELCYREYACEDCGDSYRDPYSGTFCSYCADSRDGGSDWEETDHMPDVEQDPDLGFRARAFAPRSVRRPMTVGVELEFGGAGPNNMLRYLRDWGVTNRGDAAYYSQPVEDWPEVKGDGSLSSGGELVTPKMTFSGDENRFWRIFAAFRDAVHSGDHNMNNECGLHIHVGMDGMNLASVMSATTVYNHLEDILYHLAGACYPGGHRSNSGNDYATRTPKEFDSPERFRNVVGSDRYYGLNVSNYLSRRAACRCYAGFENGDICSCTNMYKNTLEFRLFNTTANPIKMHAYAALCTAIVAYAEGKELTPNDLPAMDAQYGRTPQFPVQMYADRIVWMFQNLPLTQDERDSIRYCIRKSRLLYTLQDSDLEPELVQGILHDDSLIEVPEFRAQRRTRRRARRAFPAPVRFVLRREVSQTRLDAGGTPCSSDCNSCYSEIVYARQLHRNSAGMWVDSNNHFVSMTEDEYEFYRSSASTSSNVIEPSLTELDVLVNPF